MSLSPSASPSTNFDRDVEAQRKDHPSQILSLPSQSSFAGPSSFPGADTVFKVQMAPSDELPFAQPAAIGLVGFAVPNLLFAFIAFGWGEPGFLYYAVAFSLMMGGLLQLISAIFEAFAQNLLAFTGFGIFGTFFLSVASLYFLAFANPSILPAITATNAFYAQLMVFLMFACIALTLAIAGFISKNAFSPVIVSIYGCASGIFIFGAAAPVNHACAIISGIFGVLTSVSGFGGAGYIILKTAIASRKAAGKQH